MERVVGTRELVRISPIRIREPIVITIGTAIRLGFVTKKSGDVIEISLRDPVVAWKGARVAISRQVLGRWRLTGWGVVEELS